MKTDNTDINIRRFCITVRDRQNPEPMNGWFSNTKQIFILKDSVICENLFPILEIQILQRLCHRRSCFNLRANFAISSIMINIIHAKNAWANRSPIRV